MDVNIKGTSKNAFLELALKLNLMVFPLSMILFA